MIFKLFKIFSLAIFLNFVSFSQSHVKLFTIISYNNYSMDGLKQQQNELLNGILQQNIPAEITESYPAYYGFKIGFLIPLKDDIKSTLSIGSSIQHGSTAGRIHYQDYSGELSIDQLVNYTGIGAMIQYESHYSSNFNLGYNLSINYMLSSLSNELYLQVGNETQNEILDFSSSSFGIEPEIIPSYQLGLLQIGASLSYLIYISSDLEYDDVSEAFLVYENGDRVKINWNGFRIGAFVSISL
ncbi:MAG: hypothetical protein MUF28_04690 [Ignavibacterium sp.]|jgi:hypothetical protein|nr:hypothetical protein [Ignavibacterium sp.]